MRLLPKEQFDIIFSEFTGESVAIVDGIGNVGDWFINAATRQLLTEYKIKWQTWPWDKPIPSQIDAIFLFGGGNMGTMDYGNKVVRKWALSHIENYSKKIPTIILPQSFTGPEEIDCYYKIFVREKASLKYCPNGILAPDLSLGYEWENKVDVLQDVGCFIRKDNENIVEEGYSYNDPVRITRNLKEYLELAASFKKIVTDRLHFAIAGLLCQREVMLLPNNYHKNKSMWETWLADLGCQWGG